MPDIITTGFNVGDPTGFSSEHYDIGVKAQNVIVAYDANGHVIIDTDGQTVASTKTLSSLLNGSAGNYIGACSTSAATAAKVVTVAAAYNFELKPGIIIGIKSTNTNIAANPTINVNSTGAKPIFKGDAIETAGDGGLISGCVCFYQYDGTNWCWLSSGKGGNGGENKKIISNRSVSLTPIVLPDIDTEGMSEADKAVNATTVIYDNLVLDKDTEIFADTEISLKCNLSEDNTSGNLKVEVFYLINGQVDKKARPNSTNYYTVVNENEINILRLAYCSPTLLSANSNTFGIKLLCTGGTAEIGISSTDIKYGDALCKISGDGLSTNIVNPPTLSSITVSGPSTKLMWEDFDITDYTVTAHYSDNTTANVTNLCLFNPKMGTELDSYTKTLTASLQGISGTLAITADMSEMDHIVMTGPDYAYGNNFTLDLSEYSVIGYWDNDKQYDITDLVTFNLTDGTIISANTTLTATFENKTSSILILYWSINSSPNNGLVYLLSDDGKHVKIVGEVATDSTNQWFLASDSTKTLEDSREGIDVATALRTEILNKGNYVYSVEWMAKGAPSSIKNLTGLYLSDMIVEDQGTIIKDESDTSNLLTSLINFTNIDCSKIGDYVYEESGYENSTWTEYPFANISWAFYTVSNGEFLSAFRGTGCPAEQFSFLNSLSLDMLKVVNIGELFMECIHLFHVSFLANWNLHNIKRCIGLFNKCSSLSDITGLSNWDMSNIKKETFTYNNDWPSSISSSFGTGSIAYMFCHCDLTTLNALSEWMTNYITNVSYTFAYNTRLTSISGLKDWNADNISNISYMLFNEFDLVTNGGHNGGTGSLQTLNGLQNWRLAYQVEDASFAFAGNKIQDIEAITINGGLGYLAYARSWKGILKNNRLGNIPSRSSWGGLFISSSSRVEDCEEAFAYNNLYDINDILLSWYPTSVITMKGMFRDNRISNMLPKDSGGQMCGWMPSGGSYPPHCTNMSYMFYNNNIGEYDNYGTADPLYRLCSGWKMTTVTDVSYMFGNNYIQSVAALANWDTSNITNMEGLFLSKAFYYKYSTPTYHYLKDISALNNWDISKVTNFKRMFENYVPDDAYGNIYLSQLIGASDAKNLTWNITNKSYAMSDVEETANIYLYNKSSSTTSIKRYKDSMFGFNNVRNTSTPKYYIFTNALPDWYKTLEDI